MIRFTNFSGSPIYINPEYVTYLTKSPTMGSKPETAIHMADGSAPTVVGDIEDVNHKLVVK